MKISEIMPIILQVLKSPYVIGTCLVVIFFMNFCSFVANYRKKPPKPKKPKAAPAPAKEASAESQAKEDGGNTSESEGQTS